MNVVSIMAHQDDEMRCLGTMLKCRARGDKLHFVTLTDGAKGFVHQPGIDPGEAARIRDTEMRALANEVGASYINLQFADEFLFDTAEVRMALIEAIRATGAEIVFTHYSEDYNADHMTVHHLVRHCAMQSCLPVLPSTSPVLENHPAVFTVEPHGPFVFPASHYVEITEFFDEKVRLLRHHVSQETAMQAGTGTGIEALTSRIDAYRGEQVGVTYAEAFAVMRARGALKPWCVLP